MITRHLRYEIDPDEIDARHGGLHHGYFLPAEGASDVAYALFSFPSLAEYERYRERSASIRNWSKRIGSATNRAA